MKTFIKSHKKLSITLGVILVLLLAFLIWFQIRVGFRNLPLRRISATVEYVWPTNDSDNLYYIELKLNDPSWIDSEYATTHYDIDNLKEGDRVTMLCSGSINASDPPGISAIFMWKE